MLQKRLLIHTVNLYSVARDDYGSETETLVGQLQGVRIEPIEEMTKDSNGQDVRYSAMMFVGSEETNVPVVGMVVKWVLGVSTIRYRVEKVDRLYGSSGLSHYEVMLSDG